MATVPNKASGQGPRDKSFDNNKFDIAPSDTLYLTVPIDALYVGGDGNVRMGSGQEAPVTIAVTAGGPIFVGQVNRIYSTGTTATGLVGVASKALR